VQGCFTTLDRLLRRIAYDPRHDRLLLTGDLVNRGPRSLEVLRWAMAQGDRVVTVLGNHDVHLLRAVAGLRATRPRDTMSDILNAPDRDELIAWLRRRPLVHVEGSHVLVHAGLWPTWSVADAVALSAEVSASLCESDELLALVGDFGVEDPDLALTGPARLRTALVLMTTLRMFDARRQPLRYAGAPEGAPANATPWYEAGDARWRSHQVLFGHWAALGHRRVSGAVALDSGAVWGRSLTALRIDDCKDGSGESWSEPAADGAAED
jgi:bis(5'-nucleosyl)-tetraphosphatase (symmetrical)